MFSLQCLALRKIKNYELIPKKYQYKKCCIKLNVLDAIKNGHLECLKYFNYINYMTEPFHFEFCTTACEFGQLQCLKYLHKLVLIGMK